MSHESQKSSEKLIIIDGNAIFYRAFHALPPFKTSKGEYTNAIYGFLRMLIELIRRERPEYIAVAFDRAAKTFRHLEYEDYKATRAAPPDQLYPQLPRLKEALQIFNIPIFELDGYEADDILGTVSKIAEKKDLKTIIVTGDNDAFQLVNDHTHVMLPVKGISEVIDYTPQKIEEKTGLKPEQVADYKALKGDTSDNIKGVAGIGEKQATALLQKYQTLENIYNHLDELPKAQREKLETGKEKALINKRLVTIICDVPLEIDLEKCHFKKAKYSEVKAFFEMLEFKALLKRIENLPELIEGHGEEQQKNALQQSLF
jgi:DNA polymerase-1